MILSATVKSLVSRPRQRSRVPTASVDYDRSSPDLKRDRNLLAGKPPRGSEVRQIQYWGFGCFPYLEPRDRCPSVTRGCGTHIAQFPAPSDSVPLEPLFRPATVSVPSICLMTPARRCRVPPVRPASAVVLTQTEHLRWICSVFLPTRSRRAPRFHS